MDRGLRILDCTCLADLHGAVLLLLMEEGPCLHVECSWERIISFVRGSVCIRYRFHPSSASRLGVPQPAFLNHMTSFLDLVAAFGAEVRTTEGRAHIALLMGHGHHPWNTGGCGEPECLAKAVLGS